jgi:peroxidase
MARFRFFKKWLKQKDDDSTFIVDQQNNFLLGRWGDDALYGNAGRDFLFGNRGNDFLDGGYGNDQIFGGHGNDWLHGGMGNDKLFGGRGKNTFHFNLVETDDGIQSEGNDKIYNFHKNDILSFGGDIRSLSDLENAIQSISRNGRKLKVTFTDDGSITLYGYQGSKINDLSDLFNNITIKFSNEYRNIDGSSNNTYEFYNANAGKQFIRLVDSEYIDGLNDPSGSTRPSAREISNEIFAQDISEPNGFGASDMFWLWGQFIDHDIDLIEGTSGESFDIAVPLGDIHFDPFFTGTQTIGLTRSGFDNSTGLTSPREHINAITGYIDASNIYGSDNARAQFIKGADGKLKVSDGDLLPFNNGDFENAPSSSTDLFLAGDIRANENIALTSLHTLFVREHNRLVDELIISNPEYGPEQLYQEAKLRVEAKIQHITYDQFLPLLLGDNSITPYIGYDLNIDASISNTFAAAAYRLGHTLLSTEIERLNEDGSVAISHLSLQDAFFRPDLLQDEGQMEAIFRGMSQGLAESLDTQIVDDVRNFLFGPPGAGGFDLASLNIQRGRDHGLADYNTIRESFGLDKADNFSDITSDVSLQTKLTSLYGTVDNIDVFVGGLAEDAFNDSMLGELFHTIVLDQFTRLRDGDRFWYENRLDDTTIDEIEALTLADIIELNTDVSIIQDNPFISKIRIGGDDSNNILTGSSLDDLLLGFAGDDTLTGGQGEDHFGFMQVDGHDTITDFTPNEDKIDITAFNTSYQNLNISTQGSDSVVQIGLFQVTLENLDPGDLNQESFVF